MEPVYSQEKEKEMRDAYEEGFRNGKLVREQERPKQDTEEEVICQLEVLLVEWCGPGKRSIDEIIWAAAVSAEVWDTIKHARSERLKNMCNDNTPLPEIADAEWMNACPDGFNTLEEEGWLWGCQDGYKQLILQP